MATAHKAEGIGYAEGEPCNRNGCEGIVETRPIEGCSCHISAPCSQCTAPCNYCSKCEWDERYDECINEYVCSNKSPGGEFLHYGLRKLDPTKIDFHSLRDSGSGCSMIKRGVYPPGVTRQEVEREVAGTFGGKFNYFYDGKFEYVAYTD